MDNQNYKDIRSTPCTIHPKFLVNFFLFHFPFNFNTFFNFVTKYYAVRGYLACYFLTSFRDGESYNAPYQLTLVSQLLIYWLFFQLVSQLVNYFFSYLGILLF